MVDGETYFVGKDVASALGYKNTSKAMADHVDDEDKGVTKRYTLGGNREMTIINESGLYSLILSSKLESARRFKRWVTGEVLLASFQRTADALVHPAQGELTKEKYEPLKGWLRSG